MTETATTPVRKYVDVRTTPQRAFEVFTAGMDRWWNPDYKLGDQPFATVVIEPRTGGRWYERDEQGAVCDWGRVLAWEPPGRVVLAWQINADWQFDPNLTTEVEVRFVAGEEGTTRVELEHRGLEALGPAGDAMRAIFDAPSGWSGLLERFVGAA